MPLKPTESVRRGGPAPPVRAAFKVTPEEFAVDEVPAYEPSGSGEHLWMWVEKRGLSTFDAVRALARSLGRRERELGFAGMKDAQAVTRQWLSIQGVPEASVAGLELPGLRVLRATRHGNKIKLGHLRGNRFSILLRGADASAVADVEANLQDLARRGMPNWFGEQRFGKRGANLEKGLTILAGNPRKAARTMPKRLLSLVVSAVQSEAFNRVLKRRLDRIDRLVDGDVAWLHRNGACFVVEDAAAEQPRCEAFELSPSGPLPGPKMLRPRGTQATLEDEVLAEMELDPAVFGSMPHHTHPGERRPLRVPLREPAVAVESDGLRVSFELPRGAYATAALRELLVDAPWFG